MGPPEAHEEHILDYIILAPACLPRSGPRSSTLVPVASLCSVCSRRDVAALHNSTVAPRVVGLAHLTQRMYPRVSFLAHGTASRQFIEQAELNFVYRSVGLRPAFPCCSAKRTLTGCGYPRIERDSWEIKLLYGVQEQLHQQNDGKPAKGVVRKRRVESQQSSAAVLDE